MSADGFSRCSAATSENTSPTTGRPAWDYSVAELSDDSGDFVRSDVSPEIVRSDEMAESVRNRISQEILSKEWIRPAGLCIVSLVAETIGPNH